MAAVGVIHAASVAIHAVGRGTARALGLDPKHATKQVDRLVGNTAIEMSRLFKPWVQFIVGPRSEIVVALDWTEFDKDTQSTICLYLITRHGRATPLVWRTVSRKTLAGNRNRYEDEAIEELHRCLPDDVRVTVLANRGFGDQMRYQHLEVLGFDFVIRFRDGIRVEHDGTAQSARDWLANLKRAKKLVGAKVTSDRAAIPAVVLARDSKMKEAWCLATSRAELPATAITKLYGRRFTIEETLRGIPCTTPLVPGASHLEQADAHGEGSRVGGASRSVACKRIACGRVRGWQGIQGQDSAVVVERTDTSGSTC